MVGLLVPVPEEHLRSGLQTLRREGKVAFGSRAFEVFAKLDELRQGEPVEVLIYASDPTTIIKPPYRASWRATYIGFQSARGGAHPDGMIYRPETTTQYPADNAGHWALFWEVVDLAELPEGERVQTGALKGWGKSKLYVKHFRPEGPVLIDL